MLPSDRESWKTYLYVFSALSEMYDSSYRVFSISVEELFTKFEIRWVILQISSWKFSWTFSTLFDISWCKNWKILTNWIFLWFWIPKRHNSSTKSVHNFWFSNFKSSTQVTIKNKIWRKSRQFEGLRTLSTLCNLYMKSR